MIVLLIIASLFMAWIASEFTSHRWLRIGLGTTAIASTLGVACVIGTTMQFNCNAWYGVASKDLIDATVDEIDKGHTDRVVKVLRRVQLDFHPTWYERANYDEIVEEAVAVIKDDSDLQGTKWGVPAAVENDPD